MKDSKKTNMAIVWIVIYVVLLSAGEALNSKLELMGAATAPIAIVLTVALCVYLSKNKGWTEYGFRSLKSFPFAASLFCLPIIVLSTFNLWRGVVLNCSWGETALCLIAMLCVGFIEEVIFRGFLFRSMLKQGVKSAVIVSSVTFGLGHIINLINGAELLPTLLQLIYAISIGFMLSVFVLRTNNIIPCIIFHSIFNMLSIISNDVALTDAYRILNCILIVAISLGYAAYMWFRLPEIKKA